MGLRIFFLPNFPGATFIQGAMFIPDSRVVKLSEIQILNGLYSSSPTKERGHIRLRLGNQIRAVLSIHT